jgi:hypothetical protein
MAAFNSFMDQYHGVPGDMKDATAYWGSAGGSGTIGDGCESSVGTGTETCNGDGNGQIGHASAADEYGEEHSIWQHLANAGLIEGSYTGRAGPDGPNHLVFGENAPAGKVGNSGWGTYLVNQTGNGVFFDYNYRNSLVFGAPRPADKPYQALLAPKEAWSIDKKVDDGRPGYGKLMAVRWGGCTDAANSADVNANYQLDDSSVQCAIIFPGIIN